MEKVTRSNRIVFRLSDAELTALNREVSKTSFSREEYLRIVTKMIRPKERPPADFALVLRELSRIGNNLNQIARKANESGNIDEKEYRRNAAELQEVMSQLIREVTSGRDRNSGISQSQSVSASPSAASLTPVSEMPDSCSTFKKEVTN